MVDEAVLQRERAQTGVLHVYGRTSRTIAFRRTDSGFRWTGEQEIYTGPHTYASVDGKYREQITVTFAAFEAIRHEASPPTATAVLPTCTRGYPGARSILCVRKHRAAVCAHPPISSSRQHRAA